MAQPPTTPVDTSGGQHWPSPGWLLAGLAVVLVLLTVVLVTPRLLHPPLTDQELDRQRVTDGRDRIELKREQDKLQNDARGALLQGLGGAVLLLGAYFTWRQVQTSREQLQHGAAATRDQLQLTREGQLTERFTRAVDQLGAEHLDVRLGGIYALERIARDSPQNRATIEEVLTAFIRGHAPWPPQRSTATQRKATQQPTRAAGQHGPAADVQAALTVLGRRELPPDRLRRPDLTEGDLRSGLWRLDLMEVDLQGAKLVRANLQNVLLSGANLKDAVLFHANLQDAMLNNANLQNAELEGANLQGAMLYGANLQDARLYGANLRSAQLNDDGLQGARADDRTRLPADWDRAEAEARGVRYWHQLP